MGEFFHFMVHFLSGWRRRPGLLTLLLAFGLLALLFNSRSRGDSVLTLNWGSNRLMSLNDSLIWASVPDNKSREPWSIPIPDAESTVGQGTFLKTHEIEWRGRLLGFGFGTFNAISEAGISRNAFWSIPNWFIIIIPTLLSAYLLLKKPCESTSKKIVNPIAEKAE